MGNYGLGGVFQVGDYWHVRYSNHGHQIGESTGIRVGDDPAAADALLRQTVRELRPGSSAVAAYSNSN